MVIIFHYGPQYWAGVLPCHQLASYRYMHYSITYDIVIVWLARTLLIQHHQHYHQHRLL